MANGALGKSIGNAPRVAAVRGCVDVDFIPRSVVEVFAPVNSAARNWRDVQGARSPGHGVTLSEFRFVWPEGDDRSGYGGHESSSWHDCQSVESIAKKPGGQTVNDGYPSLPGGAKLCYSLPGQSLGNIAQIGTEELVASGGVEPVFRPSERAPTRYTGNQH